MNVLMHLCKKSVSKKIVEVAKLIVANGINIHQTDDFRGRNALMWLCEESQNGKIVEMVKLLIVYDIDINQINDDGWTADGYLFKSNVPDSTQNEILTLLKQHN